MGILGTFRKITLSLIALANVVVVAVMLLCVWAGHASPARHPICEVISLGFPIPLAINLLFLVFWLLVAARYALIPLAGLLLCFNSVRDYCPINIPGNTEESDLKVLSFNLNNYNGITAPDSDYVAIARYIKESEADIICLQETHNWKESMQPVIQSMMEESYPYHMESVKYGCVHLMLCSKYPIRWAKHIPFERDHRITKDPGKNASMVYCLDLGDDSLLVFNCHFASQGFKPEDKDELKDFVDRKTDHIDEKSYISKMASSGKVRALEADFIAKTLKKHKDASIILCGDFNSSPTSYAHHTIAGCLNDCFRQAGNGVGFSYSHYGMYVRIDHIFCSDDWKPISCKIDKDFTVSDHLPVVCWLKRMPKP